MLAFLSINFTFKRSCILCCIAKCWFHCCYNQVKNTIILKYKIQPSKLCAIRSKGHSRQPLFTKIIKRNHQTIYIFINLSMKKLGIKVILPSLMFTCSCSLHLVISGVVKLEWIRKHSSYIARFSTLLQSHIHVPA